MEDLATCANNIAEHWAAGAAVLVVVIYILVFVVQRKLVTFLYGLLASAMTYIAVLWITPHLVIFFVVGTVGMGAVACEGYW